MAEERKADDCVRLSGQAPLYEQMAEKLERLIVNGGLEPLTRMPSVRSLAMELSVNPNTVQRAYAQLEQDGYLYTVSGRGSFVTVQEEWRESRQNRIWQEWRAVTGQARRRGFPGSGSWQESGRYMAAVLAWRTENAAGNPVPMEAQRQLHRRA